MSTQKHLEQLIEDATVDCSDEYEQAMGLMYAIEENLMFPFKSEKCKRLAIKSQE